VFFGIFFLIMPAPVIEHLKTKVQSRKRKLQFKMESGEIADVIVRNSNLSLKDVIDDDLQTNFPLMNFRNLQIYSAGKKFDEDTNINQLPDEVMALSCPEPPQWSIPGPGGHLPIQAFHPYTMLRQVIIYVGEDGGRERILSPGCRIMVEEVTSEMLHIKTLHYDKRNVEGKISIQSKPILTLPDMPLTLREGQNYVLLQPSEMMSGALRKQQHLLNPGDVVKIVIDSDFIHRIYPDDTLLVVQRETEMGSQSGTIKLVRNHTCCIRPITTMQDVVIGQFHFHCSRPVKTFEDFNDIAENDPIVLAASVTNLGISVLTLDGELKLLDKKAELVNVKQAFALRVILGRRIHPMIHMKCHNAAVSAEMISLRSRWLAGIKSALGMIQTKENIKIFSDFLPHVQKSFSIMKVADRVKMSPASVVAALL